MDPIQQYIAMAFGAAVAVSGVALMLRGHRDSGRNAIEIWGQKIEISTPALVVFLVGSAIFVGPFFFEPPRWSRTLWPSPKVGRDPENTGPDSRKQQGFQTNTPGVVAEVTDFSMTGALANLSFRFSGVGENPAILCINPEKSTLIDEQTGEEWRPVSYSEVSCNAYPKGISTVIWMRFPLESALQTTFTVHVPGIVEPVKGLSLE
jgi:hypothetical protein